MKTKKRLEKYTPKERQKCKMNLMPDDDRCCGNCNSFIDELSDGSGWCTIFDWTVKCDEWCHEWMRKMDFD